MAATIGIPFNGPEFADRVQSHGSIQYGEAQHNAALLSEDEQKMPCCACYKVIPPTNASCCPGSCIWLSPQLNLCGCVWYSCWFCACSDDVHPGEYNCTDLKGNYYSLVALGKGKFGCFTESTLVASQGAQMPICCYCE